MRPFLGGKLIRFGLFLAAVGYAIEYVRAAGR